MPIASLINPSPVGLPVAEEIEFTSEGHTYMLILNLHHSDGAFAFLVGKMITSCNSTVRLDLTLRP